MALSIKPGVDFTKIHSRIVAILPTLERIWAKYGKDLVITSARDGKHRLDSFHYKGKAIDCRTRYFDAQACHAVLSEAQAALGGDFDVVLESDHIHVELDP